MIAIHTKVLPVTDKKPRRIKAYTWDKNHKPVIISFDDNLSDVESHAKAARVMIDRQFPYNKDCTTMVYGGSADGLGYTFCFPQSTVTLPEAA